ncbi:MAG TPA: M28 family metallopeptidase [Anaeromyxobacteraceae bacterium]|nr:M28 family metallopeptidase [Anaeromyxobacteraceae bacterium]
MSEDRASGRALLLGVVLLAALGAAVALGLRPTAPRSEAPPREFSAVRAERILRELLGDGAPHPVGSAAGARVRERVLAELRRLGLEPEVQETFACGIYWTCGEVRNVLARLAGREPGPAVLLVAHHDSVPAGPGASDDGAGVAALLEVARALGADPPRRPVILLVDDAEEAGLVGAAAFAGAHPWMREVGAVVNLEARGTSGPSLLFQTSGDDLWLARLAGRALPHPVMSSLFAEVYRRLPNDTDLSVFQPRGLPGLDFAFIGDAGRQHTPLDDLHHLDRSSLQHQGENALAAVRALAHSSLESPPPGRGVFFDVLGRWVIAWPRAWSPWLLALGAALLAAGALGVRQRPRWRDLGLGLIAFAAAPLLALALSLGTWLALRWAGALPRPFLAHPAPAVAVAWAAGLAGTSLAAAVAGPRVGPAGLRAGAGLGWLAAAAAVVAAAPGACHLLLVPALAASLAAAARTLAGEASAAAADLATALAAGLVMLPVAILLPDALGHAAAPAVASLVAFATWPLAPLAARLGLRSRRALAAAPLSVGLAAAAAAAIAPHATADQPEHVLLAHHQDADAPGARVLAWAESGRLPEAMRGAAPFGALEGRPLPWASLRPSFPALVARESLAAPELHVTSRSVAGTRRRVAARLVSRRGAADVSLFLPPEVEVVSAAVNGAPLPRPEARLYRRFGGYLPVRCLTTPAAGVELELVLLGPDPVEAFVADQTPGLPAEGARIAAARPPEAAPFQEGDSTLVTRRLRL